MLRSGHMEWFSLIREIHFSFVHFIILYFVRFSWFCWCITVYHFDDRIHLFHGLITTTLRAQLRNSYVTGIYLGKNTIKRRPSSKTSSKCNTVQNTYKKEEQSV